MLKFILRLLLLHLLISSYILANEDLLEIKMGYIDFYPNFYKDSNSKPTGLYIDIMNEVSKQTNIKINYIHYPPSRMANELISGNIDLWVGLSTLEGFKDNTYVSSTYISKINLKLYWINEDLNFSKENFLEELKHKKLLMHRGYSYGGLYNTLTKDKNYKITFSDSHIASIGILEKNRVDVLMNYTGPMQTALKQQKIQNLKEVSIDSYPAFLVMSKKTKNAQQILEKFEKALIKILPLYQNKF